MTTHLEISLSICAICWAIAGLCYAYAQYRDAQAWDAADDDDEDDQDDADWWKKKPVRK